MEEDRIPNFTGNTNPFMPCLDANGNYKPNYNIVGDNRIRKVFKIPVGKMTPKETEKTINKLKKLYKMANANYMHVVPNSHFWTDLKQILTSLDYYYESEKRKNLPKEPNVYYGENEMSKEYLLIGLNNSKKHGYKLKVVDKEATGEVPYMFGDIDGMLEFIKNRTFELKSDYEDLEQTIKFTLECGLNLTNGLKMERQDVYKRLDGERDYQDAKWGVRREADGTPDEEKPVAEWINYMEFHLAKAKEKVYYLKTEEALAEVRKVTALGVRAMEIHGCPKRNSTICVDGTSETKQPDGCCGIYKEEK